MKVDAIQFTKGSALLKRELEAREKDPANSEDLFDHVMKPFSLKADAVQKEMQSRLEKVEKDFQDLVVIFSEDPKGVTPEEFFGVFAHFLENWHVRFETFNLSLSVSFCSCSNPVLFSFIFFFCCN